MNPYNVLMRPIVSEKANDVRESNGKSTFQVALKARKPEIAKAVASIYGVKVVSVNTSIRRGKVQRKGFSMVKGSNKKFAFIEVEKGQSIPIFEDTK